MARRDTGPDAEPHGRPARRHLPSPHTTGGALDVGIRGTDGEALDFGSADNFWATAPTYSGRLSETARAHRLLLIEAMESTGLTNYVGEWWHWSYGDQGWALRVGSPMAYYGAVEVEDAENQRIPSRPNRPPKRKNRKRKKRWKADSQKRLPNGSRSLYFCFLLYLVAGHFLVVVIQLPV